MAKDSLFARFIDSFGSSNGGSLDALGGYLNRPKKFSPSDPGYNPSAAVSTAAEQAKYLIDNMTGIPDARRSAPPGYWEYVDYPHRLGQSIYHLRIGDCCLVLPPEFISVKTRSSTSSTPAIRQSNTIKTKHGYSRREIVVTLFFNGLDQINGYKVSSPMEYPYYVDGLRPLLAQFKCTPFLPVENEFLNATCEVYNVALSNISVSTVPGFPECLQATLVMQEFNAVPYIEMPNMFLDSFIDWDLFRYYYQQLLYSGSRHPNHLTPIPRNVFALNGAFEVFALKSDVLNGDPSASQASLFATENFESVLSSREAVQLTEMTFGLSNITPVLQLSDHATPTMQYLGGTDTVFSITFETTDRDVVSRFTEINARTQLLVRSHREFNGLGFVKINNELVNLTGTRFIMIDDVTINTVPEFPDLFNIQLTCACYDNTQKDRENLFGMRPFPSDRMGTKEDSITQSWQGLYNKISQDNVIEQRLLEFDLYPDLRLPTYSEINNAIPRIRAFRTLNNLPQIDYVSYPEERCDIPGRGPDGSYGKYLDPDFYVFYPVRYADIDDTCFNTIRTPSAPKPAKVTAPPQDWGDEIPEGASVSSEGNIVWKDEWEQENAKDDESTENTITEARGGGTFVNNLLAYADKAGYAWGTDGQTMTDSLYSQLLRTHGSAFNTTAIKWKGKTVFDCSGFISWGLRQVDPSSKGYRENCDGIYNHKCVPISKGELKPGDLCFNSGIHIACYIGNDETIEAMSTEKGVVIGKVGNRFNKFGRLKALINDPSLTAPVSSSMPEEIYGDSAVSRLKEIRVSGKKTETNLNNVLGGAFKGMGSTFLAIAQKYKIDPILFAAICLNESGNGTSKAVKNQNNPGGIFKGGSLRTFPSLQEGLDYTAYNLKVGYIDKGLVTIEQIHAKYCPIGAANDPTGMNAGWSKNVRYWYEKINNGEGPADGNDGGISSGMYSSEPVEFPSSSFSWTNVNSGKVYGDKAMQLKTESFGKPLYDVSPVDQQNFNSKGSYEEAQTKFLISDEDTISKMSVDMYAYNSRGRLLRAFPTFVMLIVDDSGDWLDARKLWSNYYAYKSIVDISIHQSDEQPAHTAMIRVTNVYENLSRAPKPGEIKYSIENDPGYSKFTKWIYETTGALFGTPKLTQQKVDAKNRLFNNINIKTGCRIHLRLGYGSNALKMPVSFNGIITEMDTGDVLTFAAQSDGLELINNPISTKPDETNKITKLQSEPSDIMASLLTDRDNWFLYAVSSKQDLLDPTGKNNMGGKWGEKSIYGIEHFGHIMGLKLITHPDTIRLEYDICKNIYYGKYEGVPFCKKSGFLGGIFGNDGEDNINFYLYNRTPWDVMKVTEQFLPEFVAQPMYHGFETRMFYGLPTWIAKYKYDIKNGTIYEYGKSFAQLHCIDSLSDIIDNQVRVSSVDLFTNCIAMYSLGGKMNSSPVCYSDKSIDWEKQRTKMIDSTVVQDYAGWDWLYEHAGFAIGKSAAIKIAISNILDSWRKTYKGEIIMMGDASIKPCDYLGINDTHARMSGVSVVRETTHALSAESGFLSSITPGMIATSTMQNSGFVNNHRSMLSFVSAVFATRIVRTASIQSLYHLGKVSAISRTILGVERIGVFSKNAWNVSGVLLKGIRTGGIVKDWAGFTAEWKTAASLAKNVKSMSTLVNGIKGGVAAVGAVSGGPIGTAVAWMVTTVLFDMLLQSAIDFFAYNNCVNIHPLFYKDAPFVSGTKGATNLVPGFGDSDTKFVHDDGYSDKGNY